MNVKNLFTRLWRFAKNVWEFENGITVQTRMIEKRCKLGGNLHQ
ncbi:hypothetical protein [Cytobacillus depressus]|nr:hypothetical protein [Cytobacillus depressus]